MNSTRVTSAEELLGHAGWARRLALHLVREPAAADDLVQDTWEVAMTNGRPAGVPLGAWLTGVMRNLARFGARSDVRRARRDAGFANDSVAAHPDELLARFQMQRQLADLVSGLREPYRSTVLLRYYDGLTAVQIGRKLGIPAATVRWRVKQGLDELRTALAERHGGGDAWLAAVSPLAARGERASRRASLSFRMVCTTTAGAAVVAVVALLARAWVASAHHGARTEMRSRPALAQERSVSPPRRLAHPGGATDPDGARSAHGGIRSLPLASDVVERSVERSVVPLGSGPMRGPTSAKVTIVEFVDYQCAVTAREEGTIERILWVYPDDVRVQIVHRPLPAHHDASFAARAALAAAAQDKFWEMHQWLLANHNTFAPADVEKYAGGLELDLDRFYEDLRSDTVSQQLTIDWATAESLGVDVTPSFFVNGRPLSGAQPFASFKPIIDEEIARADALLAAGVPADQLYNEILKRASVKAVGKETIRK